MFYFLFSYISKKEPDISLIPKIIIINFDEKYPSNEVTKTLFSSRSTIDFFVEHQGILFYFFFFFSNAWWDVIQKA